MKKKTLAILIKIQEDINRITNMRYDALFYDHYKSESEIILETKIPDTEFVRLIQKHLNDTGWPKVGRSQSRPPSLELDFYLWLNPDKYFVWEEIDL